MFGIGQRQQLGRYTARLNSSSVFNGLVNFSCFTFSGKACMLLQEGHAGVGLDGPGAAV